MIRWFRKAIPDDWWLRIVAVIYLAPFFFNRWDGELGRIVLAIHWQLMVLCVTIYGCGRVATSHPVFRAGYRNWLRATPWTSKRPLPFGPIHLALQDLVVLGCWMLLEWRIFSEALAWRFLCLFLASYVAALGVALFATAERACGYLVGFGLGFVAYLWSDPAVATIAAVVAYAIGQVGLRFSLARFPWEENLWKAKSEILVTGGLARIRDVNLSWPLTYLAPRAPGLDAGIRLADALAVSGLVGWLWIAIGIHFPAAPETPFDPRLALAIVVGTAGIRLLVYTINHRPPVSLLGRLAAGRLKIPRHDKVYVAPLLALAVGAGLCYLQIRFDLNRLLTGASILASGLAIVLGMGPSLYDWWLTGNHSIRGKWLGNSGDVLQVG
jgi:hypothetical protein